MNQNDRGNYRTHTSFTQSCLGKLIIGVAVIAILLTAAWMTVPEESIMLDETADNVRECIAAHDSIPGDWIDDAVNNIGHTFTHADSTFNQDSWDAFTKYNRMEYNAHPFFATVRIHNNMHPEGTRAGIGVFGIIIPTVSYADLLLNVGPVHKGYNRVIQQTIYTGEEEYYGENPDLKEYHYQGEATQ